MPSQWETLSYATPFYLCRMDSEAAMLLRLNRNSYDIGSRFSRMDSEVAMLYLFLNCQMDSEVAIATPYLC